VIDDKIKKKKNAYADFLILMKGILSQVSICSPQTSPFLLMTKFLLFVSSDKSMHDITLVTWWNTHDGYMHDQNKRNNEKIQTRSFMQKQIN